MEKTRFSYIDEGFKLKLLGDCFLIRPVKEPIMSGGGIYIPAREHKRTMEAQVLLVGDAVKLPVLPGERVIYDSCNGGRKFDTSDDFVIQAEHVIAKVER